ncbi:restriction endonuclease subunit S [Pseudomonas sp. RA_5y_Pfl1_P24]|uniref:restriction endonuclease subunit S n=1 Tax=Pseudomonas sp. RA_5y_Pfl1_P24 TaxID=3088706 RepID=UPI0030DC169B
MTNLEKKGLLPARRFPEFQYKAEWQVKTFKELFTIGNGRDYKHLASGDIPVYGSGGYMRSVNDYLYDGESVCIGRKGTIDNPIFLTGKFWTVDTLFYTHSFKDCLPKFIYAIFQQINWVNHNEAGGVPSLSKTNLQKIKVAVPKLDEQRKIADCLTSIDELITTQTQKLDALKTHKKSLMQKLFPTESETVPKLRFSLFRDTKEWEPTTVGKIADLKSGGTPSKGNPEFWNGSIPWASAKDMKQLFLDDTIDHITRTAVDAGAKPAPAGTILILTRGMTLLKDVPICILNREMSYNQDVKALKPKKDFNGRFLAYLLLSCKQRLLNLVDIAGHGTGRLDTEKLKALSVMLPQPAEQQLIADCLSSLEDLLTAQSQKINALKAHKKGLMQQLFPTMDEVDA